MTQLNSWHPSPITSECRWLGHLNMPKPNPSQNQKKKKHHCTTKKNLLGQTLPESKPLQWAFEYTWKKNLTAASLSMATLLSALFLANPKPSRVRVWIESFLRKTVSSEDRSGTKKPQRSKIPVFRWNLQKFLHPTENWVSAASHNWHRGSNQAPVRYGSVLATVSSRSFFAQGSDGC